MFSYSPCIQKMFCPPLDYEHVWLLFNQKHSLFYPFLSIPASLCSAYPLSFLIIIWPKTHNLSRTHPPPPHVLTGLYPHTYIHMLKNHIHTRLPEPWSRCWWERYVGPEYEQASVRRRCRRLGAHPSRAHVPPETSCPVGLPLLRHGGRRRLLGPACRLHQDQTHRRGRERGKRENNKDISGNLLSHFYLVVARYIINIMHCFLRKQCRSLSHLTNTSIAVIYEATHCSIPIGTDTVFFIS